MVLYFKTLPHSPLTFHERWGSLSAPDARSGARRDFYAGIRAGDQVFHLKLVDEEDPSIEFVDDGEHFHLYFGTDDVEAAAEALGMRGIRFTKNVHVTPWGTKEFTFKDNQGQTLYFGGSR